MERLTDDRFLKDGFYQPKNKDEEKEIRSMGKDLTFEKLYRHCAELEKKNAELQKQVDELKEKIMNLKSAMIDRVAAKSYDTMLTTPDDVEEIFGDAYESEFNEFLKQVAKEILTKTLEKAKRLKEQFDSTTYGTNREHLIATIEIEIEGIKNLAKHYGVEVE